MQMYRLNDMLVGCLTTALPLGAGTIQEALTMNKPLVAVINDQLANNHQTELASQLQSDRHLVATNCQCVIHTTCVCFRAVKE